MWIFQFIRFPNLLIVALTQYLLYHLLLLPNFLTAQISPTLDTFHFLLFVNVTVLIAASGYVINDLIDQEIDIVNKPDRTFINKQLSPNSAKRIYWLIVSLGGMLSAYLAIYVQQFPLFFIYPTAVLLLYLYSKYFKQRVLIGNVTVAIFCAFVAGVVWFAERGPFAELSIVEPAIANKISSLFWGYLFFAFFSTMYREIIKDIEDMRGDEQIGCKTLPIVFGISTAKIIALSFGIVLFVSVSFFTWWLVLSALNFALVFSILGILIPLLFSFWKMWKAKTQKEFHSLSQLAKFIMLSGLILLIIINL